MAFSLLEPSSGLFNGETREAAIAHKSSVDFVHKRFPLMYAWLSNSRRQLTCTCGIWHSIKSTVFITFVCRISHMNFWNGWSFFPPL